GARAGAGIGGGARAGGRVEDRSGKEDAKLITGPRGQAKPGAGAANPPPAITTSVRSAAMSSSAIIAQWSEVARSLRVPIAGFRRTARSVTSPLWGREPIATGSESNANFVFSGYLPTPSFGILRKA